MIFFVSFGAALIIGLIPVLASSLARN
jgi:hypothetical protein